MRTGTFGQINCRVYGSGIWYAIQIYYLKEGQTQDIQYHWIDFVKPGTGEMGD